MAESTQTISRKGMKIQLTESQSRRFITELMPSLIKLAKERAK